ncbi:glycosyltransferase [Rhodohalobacter sp.]|uniref:glycosyltransferase n=1 Tax=Rhodohalobacter sp. TaxID=1974210 RepID=UPI002ACE75CC|nr:glycosyltransferase [Rhodohalobacter sp.]MDZ7756025.1 glycosyltransferase [Rhodohalobacter sp.]
MRQKFAPAFAAACGQFIAFNRDAYDKIGGHTSVRQEIVEDVELARQDKTKRAKHHYVRRSGYDVNCRMYQSHHELFEGLRKNFFVGFGRNLPLFLFMAAMQIIVFVIPFVALGFGSPQQKMIAGILIAIFLMQRWLLDLRFKWNPLISLLQPITILLV